MSDYTPQSIPLDLPRANPDLSDVLIYWKQAVAASTNCHALATITAFSQDVSGRFKVNATINYSQTIWVQIATGEYQAKLQAYPLLIDCPAIVLGGGSTALQFPIAVGDQCLILFNDRDINNWWAGANTGPVASARLHSFSDGIALVGFQHVGTYDAAHALLTNGLAEIGVPSDASSALVRIANQTTTLNTLIGSLMSTLSTFMATSSTATTAAQIAAAAATAHTALATIHFGDLLE